MNPAARTAGETTPWWRIKMVWLVIGGPAAVVVASIATSVIAVRGADIVVTEAPAAAPGGQVEAQTPALTARNHAATASR